MTYDVGTRQSYRLFQTVHGGRPCKFGRAAMPKTNCSGWLIAFTLSLGMSSTGAEVDWVYLLAAVTIAALSAITFLWWWTK
jgi:hypothetical protein